MSCTAMRSRSMRRATGSHLALHVPMHFITPGVWKKHYGLDADKEKSRLKALQLFPESAAFFAKKKDHNKAEASLLAKFGAGLLREGKV
jgi:hypothetical protein